MVILCRVCMKKLLWKIAFLFLFTHHLFGQTVDLWFTEFDFNNKLSSVFLQSVEQDQRGFMWFGTTNGLHRFDGYEMKNYLSSDGESFGIREFNIYKLYNDKEGWLWISLNSNLCYYDIQTDSIKIIGSEAEPCGLDSYYITDYAENSDSVLFISTNSGIYKFNRDSLNFSLILKINSVPISNFIIDDQNRFWIGTDDGGGIYQYSLTSKKLVHTNLQFHNGKVPSISDLEYYNNKLWVATDGQGIWSYNIHDNIFRNYPMDSEYALNTVSLYKDKDGFLWSVDLTGLKLYVKDRDFFQGYYYEENNEYTIPQHIRGIFQDSDHNYWTIHSPGGIGFSPKAKGINRFDSHMISPFRLSADNISTICEDKYGNLWMGNSFNGIDVFYWAKGETVNYNHESNNPHSLGRGATMCIFRDSKQQMWIGSYWGGLQLYREETNDFFTYKHIDGDSTSLTYNDVRSIAEDSSGNLWLAVHGKGIDCFNPQTGKFRNYNLQNNNLANDYTYQIAVDSQGNLWVGTAWGLSCLPPGASTFKNYYVSDEDTNSISSNIINTVYIDSLNRIWFGTPQGLNQYLPETDNFKRIINGFDSKNIVSINADQDRNIWVGTFHGISRYNPENGHILNLSKDDGLISNNFLERSVYNNGKNSLFFGSINGINYFDAGKLNLNNRAPEVYITKLKILNSEITNHNSDLLSKNIIETRSLELKYYQKIIEIEFSALNYVSADKNKYSYYLEGFEETWNEPSFKRNVTYTNLDPGKYVFRVKASNNEGVWNETGTSLEIVVKPPWWDTMMFKLAIIIFIAVLILLIIFLRERNLINDKLVLEKKVEERTSELNLQKEELEKQKVMLEEANHFKNEFFNVLAHDLRGPVSNMVQFGYLLKQRFEEKKLNKVAEMIDLNNQMAKGTGELLDDLLIWGKAQSRNIHLDLQSINVREIAEYTLESYQYIASQKKINLRSLIKDDLFAYADQQSIKTIIRNLISNAIKFSYPESEIQIDAEKNKNELIVSVTDYGKGIAEDKLNGLFENNLKQSSAGTAGEKGTGLGLNLCRELIQLNKGKIWVTSKLGEGSTFYFSLSLQPDA